MNIGKKEGIIIFTKDHPERLQKTLPQLFNIDLPVILLDDSVNSDTKVIVKKFNDGQNIYYHGKIEQQRILQKLSSTDFELNSFVRTLGSNGWTLGYTRNYAIILAKVLGFERVLFMDDDIIIEDNSLVYEMFDLLNNADFVSAEIKGMPDLSVVDFIMQKVGLEPYRFMSGGFLAFNLNSVAEYFLNYYNEDWIWLFMHRPEAKLVKYGEVYQLPYDPFENAIEKALHQEFGEILVEGVKRYIEIENKSNTLLLNKDFWDEIVKMRANLIKDIMHLSQKNKSSIGVSVSKHLLSYYAHIDREKIANIFIDYYRKRKFWYRLLHVINELKVKSIVGLGALRGMRL